MFSNPSALYLVLVLGQLQRSAEALRVSQNVLPASMFVAQGLPEFSTPSLNATFFSCLGLLQGSIV